MDGFHLVFTADERIYYLDCVYEIVTVYAFSAEATFYLFLSCNTGTPCHVSITSPTPGPWRRRISPGAGKDTV